MKFFLESNTIFKKFLIYKHAGYNNIVVSDKLFYIIWIIKSSGRSISESENVNFVCSSNKIPIFLELEYRIPISVNFIFQVFVFIRILSVGAFIIIYIEKTSTIIIYYNNRRFDVFSTYFTYSQCFSCADIRKHFKTH
jgi:hypothetical protein